MFSPDKFRHVQSIVGVIHVVVVVHAVVIVHSAVVKIVKIELLVPNNRKRPPAKCFSIIQ